MATTDNFSELKHSVIDKVIDQWQTKDKGMCLHLEQLLKFNVAFLLAYLNFLYHLNFLIHLGLQGYSNRDQRRSMGPCGSGRTSLYFTRSTFLFKAKECIHSILLPTCQGSCKHLLLPSASSPVTQVPCYFICHAASVCRCDSHQVRLLQLSACCSLWSSSAAAAQLTVVLSPHSTFIWHWWNCIGC